MNAEVRCGSLNEQPAYPSDTLTTGLPRSVIVLDYPRNSAFTPCATAIRQI